MRPAVAPLVPLEFLKTGEKATICELDGRPELVHRLEEMGLRPGQVIEMIQAGRPCILGMDGHRLSLRLEETCLVLVEVHARP